MKEMTRLLNSSRTVVFMDFEGTQHSQEIIAIGALKCDLDNKGHIKKVYPGFKRYVKAHDEIGTLVTKLTGITEELLDKEGINFYYCMKYFENYVGKVSNIKFITYGNFDMRLLHQTTIAEKMESNKMVEKIYKNYIDFASLFQRYVKSKKGTQLSLLDALKIYKVKPKGQAHDPLFDAENLMLLYEEFLTKRSITQEQYKNVLMNNTSYPRPIARAINKLKDNGSITIQDLDKLIEDEL